MFDPIPYYSDYFEKIIPLLAQMQVRTNCDYGEYYRDVTEIFDILTKSETEGNILPEDKQQLTWLFQKIQIALFFFIVNDIIAKVQSFMDSTTDRDREIAGVDSDIYEKFDSLRKEKKIVIWKYGRNPKIGKECLDSYEQLYHKATAIETITMKHNHLVWLSLSSNNKWLKPSIIWLYGILASAVISIIFQTQTLHLTIKGESTITSTKEMDSTPDAGNNN